MGEGIEQIVLERKTNLQSIPGKMFNTLNHKGNSHQSYTEILSHLRQNDNNQEHKQKTMLARKQEERGTLVYTVGENRN
jgi:hypothetical protein